MGEQKLIDFERIKDAIEFISKNYRSQPSLAETAEYIHMSPYHFQRMFTEWAGVSPKQFLRYISITHAKDLLKENQASLFDAAHEVGLSGTGRLHDLFINIEGMTPGEYKNGGEHLNINYSFGETPFGKVLIASTPKGICHMAFTDEEDSAIDILKHRFSNAGYNNSSDENQQNVLRVFTKNEAKPENIKLHIKGTDFQLKVWEALLNIPIGKVTTYGDIAKKLNNPNANRAVGSAVGSNPVAYLIPCHRVIQSTGIFGQYHWGSTRKTAMIGWEIAQTRNLL